LSHTHNYYWRLDFDLGPDANDDAVSEMNFISGNDGRRVRQQDRLMVESARAINPSTMRSWIINDGEVSDTAPGYMIEPVNHGHRHVNTPTNEFTEYDFFVTKQNDCERFVSENAKFNPDCYENILQFVNDESLDGEDVVLWHRVSFHHVPKNEDRQIMHSHWDGFVMEARNLNSQTPGHSGEVTEETMAALTPEETQPVPTVNAGSGIFGCSVLSTEKTHRSADFMLLMLGSVVLMVSRICRSPRKRYNNAVG